MIASLYAGMCHIFFCSNSLSEKRRFYIGDKLQRCRSVQVCCGNPALLVGRQGQAAASI